MHYESVIDRVVRLRFPTVRDFSVDHFCGNVTPVDYYDGGRLRQEYPPVAHWRVGSRRYKYVAKPEFKREHWSAPCFGGVVTKADYTNENSTLLDVIAWSVEGLSSEEINKRLGNF